MSLSARIFREVRPLVGIRGHGAEIDRLAAGAVLGSEFRVGDVGVRGRGGDCGEIALTQDRRHSLSGAADLRTDRRDKLLVAHHPPRVGRGLRGIVLAGGRRPIIQCHRFYTHAGNRILLIRLLESEHRTVPLLRGVLRIAAGQRHVDTDSHDLFRRTGRHPEPSSERSGGC